jgi:hypothetical protein
MRRLTICIDYDEEQTSSQVIEDIVVEALFNKEVPTKNIDCADDPIKDQEKEDIKCGDE